MEDTFDGAMLSYQKRISYLSRRYSKGSGLSYEDYFSKLSEVLWLCYGRFKREGNAEFNTYVFKAISRAVIDLKKTAQHKYYDRLDHPIEKKREDDKMPITSYKLTEVELAYVREGRLDLVPTADQRGITSEVMPKNAKRRSDYISRRQVIQAGSDDDDTPTPEIEDASANVEKQVLERMHRKKEADQRQLIDFLVNDPVKVDTVTTLIVTKFPRHSSITALAKALGLHHEVVKRKLRALSKNYDANRFGDIRDYLAV